MLPRFSFASSLVAWLLLVSSDCTGSSPLENIGGDLKFHINAFAPNLRDISRRMRDSVHVRHLPLLLNRESSRLYINDVDGTFRAEVDATRAYPRKQLRLNLGNDFEQYMTDVYFRARVDALVDNPETQVWSDLTRFQWSGQPLQDISLLARLVNLQSLSLSNTQVQDIRPLAGLENLQRLNLSNTQVQDIGPLAGLVNLQTLDLSDTQVQDIRPLAGLVNLFIRR